MHRSRAWTEQTDPDHSSREDSSGEIPAWRNSARRVPRSSSRCFGAESVVLGSARNRIM